MMSDINWRSMREFVGDENAEYLLEVEVHHSSGQKHIVYEVGGWEPIFNNIPQRRIIAWCLIADSGYDYDAPLWATTVEDTIRTVMRFAIITV